MTPASGILSSSSESSLSDEPSKRRWRFLSPPFLDRLRFMPIDSEDEFRADRQARQRGILPACMSGKMVEPGTLARHFTQEAVAKEPWHWISLSGETPAFAS